MHGLQVERARALTETAPEVSWSICEVFTDPPLELSADGRPLAWHVIVKSGVVDFGQDDREDVDVRLIAPYDEVLPLARYDTRGEPERAAELTRMTRTLIKAGCIAVVGDRGRLDPRIGDFHDVMARATA